MRTIAALMLLALAGCQTCPIPETPPVVKVPVDRYIPLPEWATRQLPEDAPKTNTPEEAVRLSRARLETIRYANCRAALVETLEQGAPVSGKECK